jgi:hypothetical protein
VQSLHHKERIPLDINFDPVTYYFPFKTYVSGLANMDQALPGRGAANLYNSSCFRYFLPVSVNSQLDQSFITPRGVAF